MLDGTETFSIETLDAIMDNELSRVAPVIEAVRTGDVDALDRFEDITPANFGTLHEKAINAYEGVRQRGAAIQTDNPAFIPRVASILVDTGIAEDRAVSMATKVAEEGKVVGIVDVRPLL